MTDIYTFSTGVLHENENYYVYGVAVDEEDVFILDSSGCGYKQGYALVNKATGIIELVRATLPDVLYNSEHLSQILIDKPYLWHKAKDEMEPVEAESEKVFN